MANVNIAFKRAMAGVNKDAATNSKTKNRDVRNQAPTTTSTATEGPPSSRFDNEGNTIAVHKSIATPTTMDSTISQRRHTFRLSSSSSPSASSLVVDDYLSKDSISLSSGISAVRVHQLAVTLRPLPVGGSSSGSSRPRMSASRWEVRKALLSLCSTQPVMFEIEVTDKSASIRISFAIGAAAEDLARKLSGVTVKITGVKLHAFVREVSESAQLSEGENWPAALLGTEGVGRENNGTNDISGIPESEVEREAAFGRLTPGRRPDTIVLRGIPANWLGDGGRPAEGTSAKGLERVMSRIGPVRAVEVAPSGARVETPSTVASRAASSREKVSYSRGSNEFDVNALLENMPQPRVLAKGSGSKSMGGEGHGGGSFRVGGPEGGGVGVGGASAGGVGAGLNVDAWVQFSSFRGFDMALKVLQGRVLQKAGAELLCEYRLGADVTGYMTTERRRQREEARAKEAKEEERRKLSIEKARGQLAGLREGLNVLHDMIKDDGRPTLADNTKLIVEKVTGHVEKAEKLLGRFDVDEPAATAAVSHARGEVAIARLSIRKAREAVHRAEEEERKRLEREKDAELRDLAKTSLTEVEDNLSRGLALIEGNRDHPGIKPQADKAAGLLRELSEACSKEGGSELLRGDELVEEARKATDTATTRACMLQRYLGMCARLANLRAATATIVAGTGSQSLNDNNITDTVLEQREGKKSSGTAADAATGEDAYHANAIQITTTTAVSNAVLANAVEATVRIAVSTTPASRDCSKCDILMEQLNLVEMVLDRELGALSEGDLLVLSERAEVFLDAADAMIETVRLVKSVRSRLAAVKAKLAGDSDLKSSSASESMMRLMAAAVMSAGRAQREGAYKPTSQQTASNFDSAVGNAELSTPELQLEGPLLQAADRWTRAAQAADSDVKNAEAEVERVTQVLRQKRRREEEENARRAAEEEKRAREEERIRAERHARALEREALQRKQAETRIAAMELRQKELQLQVKNKAARERVREWFESRQVLAGKKRARGGDTERDEDTANDIQVSTITDRWSLDKGLKANDHNETSFDIAPASLDPESARSNPPGREAADDAVQLDEHESSPERWVLSDGATDLEERGIETYGAGMCLPSSSTSIPLLRSRPVVEAGVAGGAEERSSGKRRRPWEQAEADWLEMVSNAVHSTIAGDVRQDISWTLPNEDEEQAGDLEGTTPDMSATEIIQGNIDESGSSSTSRRGTKDHGNPIGSRNGGDAVAGDQGQIVSTTLLPVRGGAKNTEAELRQRLLAKMGQARNKNRTKKSSAEV